MDSDWKAGDNRAFMERILNSGGLHVLFDERLGAEPEAGWFEPDWWLARDRVAERFPGRGQALAVHGPFGDAVLRVYRRGGLVGRLVEKHYLYLGRDRVRSLAEWRVLDRLLRRGLPVPEPLAAAWRRRGPVFSAALLTRRISGALALPELIESGSMAIEDWQRLVEVLEGFFAAGVHHPDLNARNILGDGAGTFWLVDFDRARIADRPTDGRAMRRRLIRSLEKLRLDYPPDWF